MRAEPVPVDFLLRRHLKQSSSRLVIGPFDHRFLVHTFRKHGEPTSTVRVHSLTAWDPGWVEVENVEQARKLINDYSTPRYS